MINFIIGLLYSAPAVLIAISMHEFAHGYVSWKLGDPTPKQSGRLSLNPFAHLDPVGTLCLLLFHFGWAKPVGVNPWYYKNRKQGMVLVSLAGPLMNFLVALVSTILLGLALKLTGGRGIFAEILYQLLLNVVLVNIGLGLFNLIPVPPLDGSKVLGAVLPERYYFGYMRFEQYGTIVLLILLMSGFLDRPLNAASNWMIGWMLDIARMIIAF